MLLGKIFPLAREGARLITSKRSDDMPLKLVPSGTAAVADFLDPRKRRFYIDKSSFIPILEDTADVVALLRPQRWGKTVFLGVLANYYDISNAKSPFICIPGGDTSLAHSFSILRFDLALAARSVPATATVEEMMVATKAALDSAVMTAALDFVTRYKNIKADFMLSPLDLLIQLAHKARVSGAPLYVLVDECDALLRTLAITSGNRAIDVLAGRQGPLREFFGRFKSLHDTGILPRIFLTGISPMGLDTMTTGFNIVTDVSQDAPFNGAIWFTNSDLEDALFQCLGFPKQSDEQKLVIDMLKRCGNGYLFSSGLNESDGMFQSVMVVQALTQLRLLPGVLTTESVRAFTSTWMPSGPIGMETERQLLDFFMQSRSMYLLLPKIIAGGLIAAPSPLSSLAVVEQIEAAAPAANTNPNERSVTFLTVVAAAQLEPSPAILKNPAEATLARILYFEGLLTHSPQAIATLRVSNESMKHRFIDRFSKHLSEDHSLHSATLAFIERGDTKKMESLLASLCRPGLLGQSIEEWYELHCSQRLQLLFSSVTSETGVEWVCETPSLRVTQSGQAINGYADLLGRSRNGRRIIIIAVKQVNVVKDLAIFEAELDKARSQGNRRSTIYNETIVRCAKRLARMSKTMLMGLTFRSCSIKSQKLGQLCVKDAIVVAVDQVQSYVRGILRNNPGIVVEAYVILAVGPLRWHIEKVHVPQ